MATVAMEYSHKPQSDILLHVYKKVKSQVTFCVVCILKNYEFPFLTSESQLLKNNWFGVYLVRKKAGILCDLSSKMDITKEEVVLLSQLMVRAALDVLLENVSSTQRNSGK